MSQAPNSQFANQNNQQGQRPAQSGGSNVWLTVLAILGGVFLVSCLICGGVGYFMFSAAKEVIDKEAKQELTREFSDDPIFQEHIGDIQSAGMDMGEMLKDDEDSGDEIQTEITTSIMYVEGDKGSGKIYYKENFEEGTSRAVLVMEDGQEFDLEIDGGSEEPEDDMFLDDEPDNSDTDNNDADNSDTENADGKNPDGPTEENTKSENTESSVETENSDE